jgi:hypothetical protein
LDGKFSVMARLTTSEWRDLRAEWETSPRQGLTWLTKIGGGRWDITSEAIRKRRLAESWQKIFSARCMEATAHHLAERRRAEAGATTAAALDDERMVGGKSSSPTNQLDPPCMAATAAERTALLMRHREDWRLARALVEDAAAAADPLAAKTAKTLAEAIRIVQLGESTAWGLDALFLNLESMSIQELEKMVRRGTL